MKKIFALVALFAALAIQPAHALMGKTLHLSAGFDYDYNIGGEGGRFEELTYHVSPDINSMFPSGFGGRVELGMFRDENWEIHVGTGYTLFPGGSDTVTFTNTDRVDIEVGDRTAIPLYVGGRFLFGEDPRSGGFVPYIRGDIGAVFLDSVNARVSYSSTDVTRPSFTRNLNWWDSSTELMYQFGGGLEYGIGKFGIFTELLYKSYGKPDPASSMQVNALKMDQESSKFGPISVRLGVGYYF